MTTLIPSSFLPPLARARPLQLADILVHIAILRELYIPPIHGGLSASDTGYGRAASPEREESRGSANGSAKVVSSLGLDITSTGEGSGASTPRPIPSSSNVASLRHEQPLSGDDDILSSSSDSEFSSENELEEDEQLHLDPFERDWAEKWLNTVVRRVQVMSDEIEDEDEVEPGVDIRRRELDGVLRDATGVLALMAGTSAAGSLTRHLLFPISSSLESALRIQSQSRALTTNPNLSPTTTSFLKNLSISPASPTTLRSKLANPSYSPDSGTSSSPEKRASRRRASTINSSTSFGTSSSSTTQSGRKGISKRRRRRPAIPILLHDAPMADHLSVGVQTWGSAILLGREMALKPRDFGLFPDPSKKSSKGTRVLELGAGTGLLSILCRKLLDLYHTGSTGDISSVDEQGTTSVVVATDFLPSVLDNLQVCVDLNFPSSSTLASAQPQPQIQIAKLDWKTFPNHMNKKHGLPPVLDTASEGKRLGHENRDLDQTTLQNGNDDFDGLDGQAFDLVLASDCVYDPTHAKMLRDVAGWVLRLPSEDSSDPGGTFHILSPIRPTFTPELESIDQNFPSLSSYISPDIRQSLASSKLASCSGSQTQSNGNAEASLSCLLDLTDRERGEGLGLQRGLKIGVRGGKKSVVGRKGEGRVDEVAGYWWWEVGWG